jgi:hypothetical protein
VWILDIESTSVTITVTSPPGTTKTEEEEAGAIIDSIHGESVGCRFRLVFTLPDGWDSG